VGVGGCGCVGVWVRGVSWVVGGEFAGQETLQLGKGEGVVPCESGEHNGLD
jgi:hypothetical protein